MPNALTMMTNVTSGGKPDWAAKSEPPTKGDSDFAELMAEDEMLNLEAEAKPHPDSRAGPKILDGDENTDPDVPQVEPDLAEPLELQGSQQDARQKDTPLPMASPGELPKREATAHATLEASPPAEGRQSTAAAAMRAVTSDPDHRSLAGDTGRGTDAPERAASTAPQPASAAKEQLNATEPGMSGGLQNRKDELRTATGKEARRDEQATGSWGMDQRPAKPAGQGTESIIRAQIVGTSERAALKDPMPEDSLHDRMPTQDLGTTPAQRDAGPTNGVPLSGRAEIARAVAGQMAASIVAKPGSGSVEIALTPEELGKVSIKVTGREDGLHMMIVADRPETMDLMRRHISILSAEFKEMGLGDLSFDLGTSANPEQDAEPTERSTFITTGELDPATETPALARPTQVDRALDLRL
ncbi:flagellar hook-length control protein FliK [Ruegeria arenilitoris]|uniref:flagellar hook-length control protein FliK n=1 Tax=Ruegeria arenilitoris TaxID=1173585 RepID=UPI00147B376A|nr:flagellar hook-length control protein FliK [Ruegeria arenilitoris]